MTANKNRIRQLRIERGWSQADLAARLGVSRQTVNALESGRSDPALPLTFRIAWLFGEPVEKIFLADLEERMDVLNATWQYQDRVATAFDEVNVMDRMGQEGWEMIGFGPAYLRFRRPEDETLRIVWQYQREPGILSSAKRSRYEADGWTYCGSWMGLMHYFKRSQN